MQIGVYLWYGQNLKLFKKIGDMWIWVIILSKLWEKVRESRKNDVIEGEREKVILAMILLKLSNWTDLTNWLDWNKEKEKKIELW